MADDVLWKLRYRKRVEGGLSDVISAVDRDEAELIGMKVCEKNGWKYVGVGPFCIADRSILAAKAVESVQEPVLAGSAVASKVSKFFGAS